MKPDQATVALVVSKEEREEVRSLAQAFNESVSSFLAKILRPLLGQSPHIYRRSIRRHKDELFITLPRAWVSRAQVKPGDRVTVITTDTGIMISRK